MTPHLRGEHGPVAHRRAGQLSFSIAGDRGGSTFGLTRVYPRVATMEHMTERDVVTVRGLRKAYGTRVVVHELDLDVRAGAIVGLAACSAAGRATTDSIISGLMS